MKRHEVDGNLYKERQKLNDFQNYIMQKELAKEQYVSQRKDRMREILNMKVELNAMHAREVTLKQ